MFIRESKIWNQVCRTNPNKWAFLLCIFAEHTRDPVTQLERKVHPNFQKKLFCRPLQRWKKLPHTYIVLSTTTGRNNIEFTSWIPHQYQIFRLGPVTQHFWLQLHQPDSTQMSGYFSQKYRQEQDIGSSWPWWLVCRPCTQFIFLPHYLDMRNTRDPHHWYSHMVPHQSQIACQFLHWHLPHMPTWNF